MKLARPSSAAVTDLTHESSVARPPTFHLIGAVPHSMYPIALNSPEEQAQRDLLLEYCEAFSRAEKRVWILDRHFDGNCGILPHYALLESTRVSTWILTGKYRDATEWIKRERLKLPPHVELSQMSAKALESTHDRFALIDDDLWHFGATVGGAYGGLSATSRGWRPENQYFEQMFSDFWRKAKGI